jgi:hypothetical protein
MLCSLGAATTDPASGGRRKKERRRGGRKKKKKIENIFILFRVINNFNVSYE